MEEKVVKKYLTKKRLIFIIVFFVVAIGLFAANILFVLNVD
jgi:preprotein translocase subunit SecG